MCILRHSREAPRRVVNASKSCADSRRRRAIKSVREREVKLRFGYGLGVLAGSAGLFFAPALLAYYFPFLDWFSRGLPEIDMAIFGLSGHGNPFFYSAAAPFALAILTYALKPARGLAAGLAIGVAANLIFTALWGTVTVRLIP